MVTSLTVTITAINKHTEANGATIQRNHPKGRLTAIGYRQTVIRLSSLGDGRC